MAEVRAFRAIRYDHARWGADLSAYIAPPYDVLDQADKDALLRVSDRNIVAIDLPHIPPKSAGPPEAYARSAATLREWRDDGTLVREAEPALYFCEQVFEHEGRRITRRQFVASLRLTPFSEGVVVPHEETFGGPKEDRLALMKATACNLSPVFGLFRDPDNRVSAVFDALADRPVDYYGTLDGAETRVRVVTDRGAIEGIRDILSGGKVYIADGHHRYGTALMYRDWVMRQEGRALADDHPANTVMMVLASMDDPGCLILPYPRVLVASDGALSVAALMKAWSSGVEPGSDGDSGMVLYDGAGEETRAVRFTGRSELDTLASDKSAAWRRLDMAYVHRYLIEHLLGARVRVEYVKSEDAARARAREAKGVALLPRAVPLAQLQAVCDAGDLMPQKSTYFHPKLVTGLTIHSLAADR